MSRYTWIVTKDEIAGDASDAIGRIGPPGFEERLPFNRVISAGEQFRLLDSTGQPRYSGFILGQFDGAEPLEEYGRELGCVAIEFWRNNRWVRVEGADRSLGDTAISHFSRRA